MEFVVVLAALAIERWTPIGKLVKNFQLLDEYLGLFQRLFMKIKMPAWLNLLMMLIPLLLGVSVLYAVLSLFWYGSLYFVFSLVVLLYCFGSFSWEPQNSPSGVSPIEEENLVVGFLIQSNRNIFAVLFWFAILGPVGAILYRFIEVTAQETGQPELVPVSTMIRQVMDWVPVRLIGLGCALVSHFREVMSVWLKECLTRLGNNENFLARCGLIALKQGLGDKVFSLDEMRELSEALVDRTLALWLVMMALVIVL